MELLPPTLPVVVTLGRNRDARAWLAALPRLIEEVRDAFGIELSAPLHGGSCSWVAPCALPDGTAAVVKIGWPHREMTGEAAALLAWGGRGAVRLLARDPDRHALLLERCVPGQPVAGGDAVRIACGVLRELWAAAPPDGLEELGTVAGEWADLVEERMARLRPPYDPGLVAEGAGLLRELPATAQRRVLLHGDFNPGNVLSHGAGWVSIDPKPMTGDPGYDPWPLLQIEGADPVTLAGELGLDRDRVVAWCVARYVETALWHAHHGDVPAGAAAMEAAARVG
ncbi:aminoglycoside phosphotransferase family protein [Dactylosporangium sucinum]|uniref:Hydroxyurea phosphotransferase n=1 Tax=Dactylosporangium sucinum TaxID=1424081 RepID=A0A917U4V2_9ACTN|nr:aminoglycoside phosphotransferase family protein [Dactylosporangium sucinum]GGM55314.1 hydroxyurea phosphotransferase [Dactylosporangium sucinum]